MSTDPIWTALEQFHNGEIEWAWVFWAAQDHGFTVRPMNGNGDYIPCPGSFEDTATKALQRRWITREQWNELRYLWKTMPPRAA